MHKAASRTVLLLFVVAWLAMPWAASAAGPQASPRPARALQSGALGLFSQLWSFFGKIGCNIDPSGLCAPKIGCNIDPDGLCAEKNGCQVDPDGRCLPHGSGLVAGDNGCGLDPDGGRCPASTKNGCEFDPDGRCVR